MVSLPCASIYTDEHFLNIHRRLLVSRHQKLLQFSGVEWMENIPHMNFQTLSRIASHVSIDLPCQIMYNCIFRFLKCSSCFVGLCAMLVYDCSKDPPCRS
jgi:hypothetical protein